MNTQIIQEHVISDLDSVTARRRWYVKAECKSAAERVLREQDDIHFFGWQTGAGGSFGYQVGFVRWDNARKAYVFEQFSGLDV